MKPFIVLILAVGYVPLFAQEQIPAKLTFRDAVKTALMNNVDLNQQKNQLEYTAANKTSSLLQLGPSVSASGSASRTHGNVFIQNEGKVVDGVSDYLGASLNANMPVFNGLRQVNLYRQSSSLNEAQLYQVNRAQQDVIRDVANQYLTALLDYQLIKIDEENVAAQKILLDQIKAQGELGSKAEADVYNQEYQVKNAELKLVRSRNKLKNDKATLAQTLLLDPIIQFELEDVAWNIDDAKLDTLALEQMYATASQYRSDLKQADFTEKAAKFGLYSTRGRYFPSLSAGASYSSAYNNIHGDDNVSFNQQFTDDNAQIRYGLSLSIPIYYGLSYRAQTASARVTYENAKLTHKGTEVTVKTDVLLAYQNFKDAVTYYDVSASQMRAAELSYQTEKERYDLGISDIVQLSVVNQTYVEAKVNYQNSMFTLMFQKLLVNYALGTLKFEDIP